MKKLKFSILLVLAALVLAPFSSVQAEGFNTGRPRLLLTEDGVKEIKESLGKIPGFDASVEEIKKSADAALLTEIVVPQPLDQGGGYSHELHKQNYYSMYYCGIMYQLTEEAKYAEYVKDMLYKYADMYPTLDLHPNSTAGTKGRLFWQSLNEYVWLIHTANAYDCVYEYFSEADREYVEGNLFRPMAEFFSVGNEKTMGTFNRMHNHGTWATASVGLIAIVMDDRDLLEQALYGTEKDGNGGFVRHLDGLFSPDGYYTEGAYYQRYAIWPFVVFAQIIDHNRPELGIYNYRDGILKKATSSLVHQTYNRRLFMFNDALEKTLDAQEIINAVDATYKADPSNKQLLSIAADQNKYVVSSAGLATARAVAAGEAEPFQYESILLRDGADGSEGGIGILRQKDDMDGMAIVFKAASHGMGHGNFDRLCIALYDNKTDIIPDYGASRFLNLEPKTGGGYTSHNTSYSRQTGAHVTVAVDQKSHFEGSASKAGETSAKINFFEANGTGTQAGVQIVSAIEPNAAEGVVMNRTVALIETGTDPLVIDIFRLKSDETHRYDFPFYYDEQLVTADFNLERNTTELKPFGTGAGFQHLWLEAEGKMSEGDNVGTFTWFKGNRFYSVNTLADQDTKFYQVRTGANDPQENLRIIPAIIITEEAANHTFVSTIESHGLYDLIMEVTSGYQSNVENLELVVDNDQHSVVVVTMKSGVEYTLCVQNEGSEAEADAKNTAKGSNGQTYNWTGDFALFTK